MKKVLIVICVIVSFTVVLGLTNRLTVEGFNHAEEMIDASIYDVAVDFDMLRTVFRAVSIYNSESDLQTDVFWSMDGEKRILWFGGSDFAENPDAYGFVLLETTLPVEDLPQYERVFDIARDFTHEPYEVNMFGIGKAIGFMVDFMSSILKGVFALLFDLFGVAWDTVSAGLYLLGL